MKKVVIMIISIIAILTYCQNVFAKDTFKSINKYEEESLNYIYKSYNKNNKSDGLITAGIYVEKKDEEKDTQIIIAKYDEDSKEIWTYNYGKSTEDRLFYLTYSYNENNEINGYILIANETKEKSDTKEISPLFIRIDLDGKLVEEKAMALPSDTEITKVVETYNEEKKVNGYIVVGSEKGEVNRNAFLAKYNLNLDKEIEKTYSQESLSSEIKDIISANKTNSYRVIMNYSNENENENKYSLLSVDNDGNIESTIKENFESNDNPKLLETEDSYLLYGYNHNVKLKNDKTTSYYIIKYNSSDNIEQWETIGNIPVNDKKVLQMQSLKENENAYLIMYINDNDNSIEITRVNTSGEIENKIKKINNDYYLINRFLYSNDILYFVGQITCPDDDNCDYDMKSLFLVSTEDKVIEVKEEDNTAIFIVMGAIIVFIILLYILRKLQKKKED